MRGFSRKRIIWGILFVYFILILSCSKAFAQDDSADIVRVGYYENEVFEEGASEGAVKTGYAYEYYQKISEYTGWDYEYVYGSFGDLYDMLLSGDIDVIAGLAKRDDRVDIIGYPNLPMGNEIYTLLKHEATSDVTTDLATLSGVKIGVLKSAIADSLKDYLEAHNVEAELVYFDDYESLFDAFDQNEISVLAAEGDGAYGRAHAEVLCNFGTTDYYLCVNIKRQDLLSELDIAQSQLSAEEPSYLSTLRSKYYSASVSSLSFTATERDWISDHKSIYVGFLKNYLPYSGIDSEGNVTGIISDIIPEMFNELKLSDISVDYSGYDNYDDMIADISAGRIDVAFPVGGGLYYSEESGIYQSNPVASASTDLVYAGDYNDEVIKHFAVNENNRMQYYYIRTNFPAAEITLYPSIDDCLEAVLDGKANATTLNGLRANDIIKNRRYKGLYLKQLTTHDDRCFGVRIGNEGLLKLLNRGINVVGAEYAQGIAYKYAGQLYSYTFWDMVNDYIWLFVALILLVALLIIIMVVRDMNRTRRASRLKSDFVSHMSHEIRTPLTAILGMNELIQLESRDETILGYSNNIEKAGESLLGIINDILDFSKIEAGRMELFKGEYSIRELLTGISVMMGYKAGEKGLGFDMVIDKRIPDSLFGDVQKIRQIMTNLLSNAIKYTDKGEVRLTMELLSLDEKEAKIKVTIDDTGIGIREEEMAKLYSAFDRLDMENTKNIEGSGLGLTITQRMLEMMGSEVHVKSVYGRGSSFFFELRQEVKDPAPIGEFIAHGEDAEIAYHGGARFTAPDVRLLIVDDTPMNLQVISGLLKHSMMQIDTAESGAECIELFGKNDYDMVFLDQRMPQMDGVETLSELMRNYPDKVNKTPMISLTANVLSNAREQMIKAGFNDYLTKPVKLSDMEEMCLKYLPKDKIAKAEAAGADQDEQIMLLPENIRNSELLDVKQGIEYCGDAEDYMDAYEIYTSSIGERSALLEKHLLDNDMEGLALLAHSIKSTSKSVGVRELPEMAAGLEQSARNGDVEAVRSDLPEFLELYRKLS